MDNKLITYKIAKAVKQSRNSSETKQKRSDFIPKYEAAIERYHIISVDEVNFNLYQHHTKGRAPKGNKDVITLGEECVYNITSQPGDGITAIAAISSIYGVVFFLITDQMVKQNCLVEFLKGLNQVLIQLETEHPYLLLLDNVLFHNCPLVNETLDKLGLKKLNTPPNSPFLNPIEYCFSKVKNITKSFNEGLMDDDILRHKALKKFSTLRETRKDLGFNYFHNAFGQITVQNCNNWFNRVWKYFPKCREKEDLIVNKFTP